MTWQAIWGLARADFLERTRRYSFLVTLLFAVFLGFETATGRILIQLGEHRGVYTSGWIGTLMAMVISCFVSLIGFYIVKNSVERDRATGVGAILAATPLSKPAYAIGKWLSNFAVLAAIVGILAIAALLMQFIAAEDSDVNLWALLSPFLLLALPAMAVTAALALCFEMLPGLRGGAGSIIWFFLWTTLLSLPLIIKTPWLDPIGLATVMRSLSVEASKYVPGYRGGMSFQIQVGQHIQVAEGLRWAGIDWNWQKLLLRLFWVAASAAAAIAVSLVFDRFDNQKASAGDALGGRQLPHGQGANSIAPLVFQKSAAAHLTPVGTDNFFSAFIHTFKAELILAVKGGRWWWYAVAAGLLIAEFASALSASRGPLLAVAWIWPTLIWSGLGTREETHGTQQVIFACPGIVARQLPAAWVAGVFIAVVSGAGAGVRLAVAGDWSGGIAWLAGAVFVPSLALALGVWSGSGKFFEALYTALWYVGPMNHTPGLDYTGSAGGPTALHAAIIYLAISAALLALALLRRKVQLRGSR
jgi:hypothetical protein